MIQVNELRVGNYVKTSSSDIPYLQIKYGYEIDYASSYNDAIPLTPEILEKAGLRFESNWLYFRLDEYKTHYKLYFEFNDRYVLYECIPHQLPYAIKKIHYLHQLQNLYFSLTGEELIINL